MQSIMCIYVSICRFGDLRKKFPLVVLVKVHAKKRPRKVLYGVGF